jgi:hypothetical protein
VFLEQYRDEMFNLINYIKGFSFTDQKNHFNSSDAITAIPTLTDRIKVVSRRYILPMAALSSISKYLNFTNTPPPILWYSFVALETIIKLSEYFYPRGFNNASIMTLGISSTLHKVSGEITQKPYSEHLLRNYGYSGNPRDFNPKNATDINEKIILDMSKYGYTVGQSYSILKQLIKNPLINTKEIFNNVSYSDIYNFFLRSRLYTTINHITKLSNVVSRINSSHTSKIDAHGMKQLKDKISEFLKKYCNNFTCTEHLKSGNNSQYLDSTWKTLFQEQYYNDIFNEWQTGFCENSMLIEHCISLLNEKIPGICQRLTDENNESIAIAKLTRIIDGNQIDFSMTMIELTESILEIFPHKTDILFDGISSFIDPHGTKATELHQAYLYKCLQLLPGNEIKQLRKCSQKFAGNIQQQPRLISKEEESNLKVATENLEKDFVEDLGLSAHTKYELNLCADPTDLRGFILKTIEEYSSDTHETVCLFTWDNGRKIVNNKTNTFRNDTHHTIGQFTGKCRIFDPAENIMRDFKTPSAAISHQLNNIYLLHKWNSAPTDMYLRAEMELYLIPKKAV